MKSAIPRLAVFYQAFLFWIIRGSRERRSPLTEIVTDSPAICQRDTGQRDRSAMDTPRHEGTPYVIEVTSRPGKYELLSRPPFLIPIFQKTIMVPGEIKQRGVKL